MEENKNQKPIIPGGGAPQAPKNRVWIYIVMFAIFIGFTFIDFGSASKEINRQVLKIVHELVMLTRLNRNK
jgi:hypothetical protein